MAGRRVVLLVGSAVLLLVVMTGAQIALTARTTLLSNAFLARHLGVLASELAVPATRERVVGSVVQSLLSATGTTLPPQVNASLTRAVTNALTPEWILAQAQALGSAVLDVLLGRAPSIAYTLDLTLQKARVVEELSAMTGGHMPQIREAVRSFPGSLPVESVVGPDLAEAAIRVGRLWVPLSLLFLYVGPAAMMILCQLVGGVRHGLWVAGLTMAVAALLILAIVAAGYGALRSSLLDPALAALPPAAAWMASGVERIVADIRAQTFAVAAAFAAVGASMGVAGLIVAAQARRMRT